MPKQFYNKGNKRFMLIDTDRKGGILKVSKIPFKNYPVENLDEYETGNNPGAGNDPEILTPKKLKGLSGNDGLNIKTGGRSFFIPVLDIVKADKNGNVKLYLHNGALTEKKPGEYEIVDRSKAEKAENMDDSENSGWDDFFN